MHVNAHLVGAPGLQPALDQRGASSFRGAVMGDGMLAAPHDRHLLDLRRRERRVDRAVPGRGMPAVIA
jgi:hypothetical protein